MCCALAMVQDSPVGSQRAKNLDGPRINCNVCRAQPARSVVSRILAEIEAELATVRPAEKTHLNSRRGLGHLFARLTRALVGHQVGRLLTNFGLAVAP